MSYTLPKIISLVSLFLSIVFPFVENEKARKIIIQMILYETTLALLFVIKRLEGA